MATSFIMAVQRDCFQWKSVLLVVTFCILIDCTISVEHIVPESCGEASHCPHGLVCAPGSVCIPADNLLTIFEPGYIPLGSNGLQAVSVHAHNHGSTSSSPVHQDYKRSKRTGSTRNKREGSTLPKIIREIPRHELQKEEQKLKEEVGAVQQVEETLDGELEQLKHLRPTKQRHSETDKLSNELKAMKALEKELVSQEEVIEERLEDIETSKFEEDSNSYEEDSSWDEESTREGSKFNGDASEEYDYSKESNEYDYSEEERTDSEEITGDGDQEDDDNEYDYSESRNEYDYSKESNEYDYSEEERTDSEEITGEEDDNEYDYSESSNEYDYSESSNEYDYTKESNEYDYDEDDYEYDYDEDETAPAHNKRSTHHHKKPSGHHSVTKPDTQDIANELKAVKEKETQLENEVKDFMSKLEAKNDKPTTTPLHKSNHGNKAGSNPAVNRGTHRHRASKPPHRNGHPSKQSPSVLGPKPPTEKVQSSNSPHKVGHKGRVGHHSEAEAPSHRAPHHTDTVSKPEPPHRRRNHKHHVIEKKNNNIINEEEVLSSLMDTLSDTNGFKVQSGRHSDGRIKTSKAIAALDVNALERQVVKDVQRAKGNGLTSSEAESLEDEVETLESKEDMIVEDMVENTNSGSSLDEIEKRVLLKQLLDDLLSTVDEQLADSHRRDARSLEPDTDLYSQLAGLDDRRSAHKLTDNIQQVAAQANDASIDDRSKRYASWVSALKGVTKSGAVVTPASNGVTYHYRNGERTKHVKEKRSPSGYSSHHHHAQSRPHTAHKPATHPHTSTHKHHNPKSEEMAKGKKDMDRCGRCEAMIGELVCGENGKTYNSLCHAVNCAGLSQDDIAAGPCTKDDVCSGNECGEDSLCVALTKGMCLALYSKDLNKRLTCRQYMCVSEGHCSSDSHSHVCGLNGKTYPSLCYLHKAEIQLAYSGMCRPHLCKSKVCGRDGVTYPSSCHARAQGIRIDYPGDCFAESHYPEFHGCSDVVKSGRCPKLTCPDPVLPRDNCCPVCGGALVVRPDSKALAALVSNWEDVNHLYIVENFLRKLLPKTSATSCELTASVTNSGNISVILEAMDTKDVNICKQSTQELANAINSHSPNVEDSMLRPMALTAAMIGPMGGFNRFLERTQDTVLSLPGQAKGKLNDGLNYADRKTSRWEDEQLMSEHNSGTTVAVSTLTVLTVLGVFGLV